MKKQKSKQAKKASKLAKAENLKQKTITVKNAEGDPDTTAEIIVHNKIDYTPKVSVIIPVYNVEKYLPQCLDSVVKQTLKEIEIICVDDGSTDNSLEILKEYAAKDNRITVIAQKNLHAGVARNAGLAVAKGEYVHFLDSDDWVDFNTYKELYSVMLQQHVDFIKFKSFSYDEQKQTIINSYFTNMDGVNKQLFGKRLSLNDFKNDLLSVSDAPWSGFYNRNKIINCNILFDNLICANDTTFFYRCLVRMDSIFLLDRRFVYYRVNNPKSLIGIRAKYFDCQIKQYHNILDVIQSSDDVFIVSVKKHLIHAILWRYKKYITDPKLENFYKVNLDNNILLFLKDIDEKYVCSDVMDVYYQMKKEKPCVSIIIPVYNSEPWLQECLDSVVNQTLRNIEIICINDGSTDRSLQILQKYAEYDKRVVVINNKKNLGAPGAVKNIGLSMAKGEYIGFVDSDDYIDLTYFETLYSAAVKNDADIAASLNLTHVYENKMIQKVLPCNVGVLVTPEEKSKLMRIGGSNCSKIYRNMFIKHNSIMCCNVKNIAEDNYFSMCSMVFCNKIITVLGSAYYYRHRANSITSERRTDKDFYILDIYKQIDEFVSENIKDKSLKIRYLEALNVRKMQDIKWFINDCVPEYLDSFNDKVKQYFPEIYYKLNHIIVSLTSFPARIETVNQTIESLLNQTLKADKVILWLAPEQFPNKEADLPKQLLDLREKGLTIDWYHDIRSYKKLIPTLKKYPDAVIVTADDDIIYAPDCLRTLYSAYLENPHSIIANRTTRLYQRNEEIEIFPRIYYKDATKNTYHNILKIPCIWNMQTGCGAVLYPPHCFAKDILNEELIKQLAATNDDQWFWAMGALNGYFVTLPEQNLYDVKYVPGSQDGECLWKINDRGDKLYFRDLSNIIKYYPQLQTLLNASCKDNNLLINKIVKNYTGTQSFSLFWKNKIENWYFKSTGSRFDINFPRTYNEKLQWLKIYNALPIKTSLADKYLVRDWVKEKIGEQYLVPLLGVYDKFEDIDFAKLPDRFVIKCNHGSGWNIIVKDKSKLDLAEVKQKLDKWMHENFAFKFGYELHYRDIQPKIIVEKYINPNFSDHEIQVWCFNAKIQFVSVESIKDTDNLVRGTFYPDGTRTKFEISPQHYKKLEKIPSMRAFNKAIELAKKMLIDVPYVRIDFIEYKDDVRFREMTFTSGSGLSVIKPDKYNFILGNLIKLPKLAYDIDSGKYYKLPKKSRVLPWLMLPFNYLRAKCLQHKLNNLQVKQVYKQLSSFRIDVKNLGTAGNSLEVVAPKAAVNMPAWFANAQGKGCVVSGTELSQSLNLKAVKDGKLQIFFRGPDKRFNNVRYPLWIDYKSIKINGKEILSTPVATWHDKPFKYEMPVKDGQNITVEIKQQPHQYSVSELKDVILKLNPNNNYIKSDIAKIVAEAAKTYKQPRKPKAVAEIKPSAEEQARQQMLALLQQSLSVVQAANKEISSLKATVNLLQKELAAIKIEQVNTQKMLVDEQTLLQKRRKLK